MTDFEAFEEALASSKSYNSNLARSLSLTLDEFYQDIKAVGVSSMTGEGFGDFLNAVDVAALEYEKWVLFETILYLSIHLLFLFVVNTYQSTIAC